MASKATPGRKPQKGMVNPPKWVLHELWLEQHGDEYRAALLRNIKESLPGLEALRIEAEAQWPKAQAHPFNPRSFEEFYRVQPTTQKIATVLQELLPERPLRKYFCKVVAQGTGREFHAVEPVNRSQDVSAVFDAYRRAQNDSHAIIDAYGRAIFYLTMACEAGRAVPPPPDRPPAWWIALLYLFQLY